MLDLRPVLEFSGQIRAILLDFGPLCLDLGHFAQIWAILLGFGLFSRIWVRIGPKGDKALRMGQGGGTYGRTYGRTDSPCVLQDFVPFGAAAQKGRILKKGRNKKGSKGRGKQREMNKKKETKKRTKGRGKQGEIKREEEKKEKKIRGKQLRGISKVEIDRRWVYRSRTKAEVLGIPSTEAKAEVCRRPKPKSEVSNHDS